MKKRGKSNSQKTLEYTFGLIATVVGAILLFIGISMFISNSKFKKNNVEVTATVIDSNSANKYTAVTYYVDGKEINASINKYVSGLTAGSKTKVFYNKNNPTEILLDEESRFAGAYLGIGVIVLATGLFIVLHKLNNAVDKETLKKTGMRIKAKFTDIECDTKMKQNGEHPYYVICTWKNKLDNREYTFKSNAIWYNPEEQIKKSGNDEIPVYIIPTNPKKYYVAMEEYNSSNIEEKSVDKKDKK